MLTIAGVILDHLITESLYSTYKHWIGRLPRPLPPNRTWLLQSWTASWLHRVPACPELWKTIKVTSQWAWWRLKSPASRLLSKKTSKLHVTGLCAGNSPLTSEFPAQMTRNAENVSIWLRYHTKAYSSIQYRTYRFLHFDLFCFHSLIIT